MSKNKIELSPCPVCGGRPGMIEASRAGEIYYKIMCQSCGAAVPFMHSQEEAAAAWNGELA